MNRLAKLINNYVFGFMILTAVYVLMVRGLIEAGKHMNISREVTMLYVAMATLLYGLAALATYYFGKSRRVVS